MRGVRGAVSTLRRYRRSSMPIPVVDSSMRALSLYPCPVCGHFGKKARWGRCGNCTCFSKKSGGDRAQGRTASTRGTVKYVGTRVGRNFGAVPPLGSKW
jgi:hypothetical protein